MTIVRTGDGWSSWADTALLPLGPAMCSSRDPLNRPLDRDAIVTLRHVSQAGGSWSKAAERCGAARLCQRCVHGLRQIQPEREAARRRGARSDLDRDLLGPLAGIERE